MVINFGQQITGQSMMNNYSTKVYSSVFTDDSTILLINALNYTFGILFTLTCTFYPIVWGRTTMLVIAGIGQGVMLLIAATVYVTTPNILADDGVGAALVLSLFLFTFFYKPGWGATVWIYSSEIFPMSVRGTAVSICTNTQNVSNLVMLKHSSHVYRNGFYALYVWMGVNFVLAVIVWRFYPETKGRQVIGGNGSTIGGADKVAVIHQNHKDDFSYKDEKTA
ncbi:general substrate transporter [Circinella umbellata]|nr:general substrate transporter [Circinella umbellata]